jgi:DNA relaxase NicK
VDCKRRDCKAYQVNIGSRQSNVFVRCYDKGLESKDPVYADCVRLEIEYKGKEAQRRWEALADGTATLRSLLGQLLVDLNARGIDTSIVDLDRQAVVLPKAEPTKENVLVGWWASQVAPSVARYSAAGGWQTAFSVLFGKSMCDYDKTAILNALSLQWG